MASRSVANGGNNCPTSNRDGYCVTAEAKRESVREGYGRGGEIFLPDAEDQKAIAQRAAENAIEDAAGDDWDWRPDDEDPAAFLADEDDD